ncbi:hypothetical protein FHS35_002388 [Streptomyces umbrinus]|uniref:hypothetical protein n=1 Tax=Streptomyces umbrinus TaxID=67370 RepID=UPI00167F0063|nr:hypothetical protein [Streptomyces umbrinus]MCR3725540.1 hypothetical protein [Streptomyces umbrinus]GHH45931.1 lipoprotein [Streptomyces umbrinus]
MRRTALAALCIAATAAVSLTGCLPGEEKADSKPKGPFAGQTGGEIADQAVKATSNASSLRMKGDIQDDGSRVGLDMALDRKGECAGTMSANGQGKADLVKTGDTLYMKYDEKFLRAQSDGASKEETDGVVAMLADKWTKMSATGSDAKDIASFCDLDTVLADFQDVNSDATRGKTTTVDGTPAIVLHEKDGKDAYTLYVATEGKPYLLKVVSKSADDPGTVTFGDFDTPVPAEKPAGKVMDLDEMGG